MAGREKVSTVRDIYLNGRTIVRLSQSMCERDVNGNKQSNVERVYSRPHDPGSEAIVQRISVEFNQSGGMVSSSISSWMLFNKGKRSEFELSISNEAAAAILAGWGMNLVG